MYTECTFTSHQNFRELNISEEQQVEVLKDSHVNTAKYMYKMWEQREFNNINSRNIKKSTKGSTEVFGRRGLERAMKTEKKPKTGYENWSVLFE